MLDEKANTAHIRIDSVKQDMVSRWKEVDALRAEVGVLKEQLAEIKHTNKLITWFSGIVGSTVILWFVSQVLGMIQ